jgi:two-component system sensor histidine kinase CssS
LKNRPLFVQIWLVIAAITTGTSLLLLLAVPFLLGNYFTREIYRTIEDAQNSLFAGRQQDRIADRVQEDSAVIERDQAEQNIRTVRHLIITTDGRLRPNPSSLPANFKQMLIDQARAQKLTSQRYEYHLNGNKVYYTIRSESLRGNGSYVLSYMWDEHRNKLVKELSYSLSLIVGVILLFSWIPALWLAKYLSKPIVKLETAVKHIADRHRKEPIDLNRKDEIGRLARSIDQTRLQLIRQDETQQSLLQHISHELKTPVMVIRSYAQSILDGIFPKGDLHTSVEVIDHEAERLGIRVRDLLYLTKLDYMSAHMPVPAKRETIRIDLLAEEVVERMQFRRTELLWTLQLQPLTIEGDKDQWIVALENVLDNQIRYAKSEITVGTSCSGDSGVFMATNDGPPIEPDMMQQLFGQFRSGPNGEFGLGLAIVKRIALLHGASVRAENRPGGGVTFTITFEKALSS